MTIKDLLAVSIPQFTDKHQQKAFLNIIRFFAIMIILTLASRAMANATLPSVTTVSPLGGVITKQMEITGQIAAEGGTPIMACSGLTVLSVPVQNGEYIQQGNTIAVFDKDEISAEISMQNALIAQLSLRQAQLRLQPHADSSAVAAAQNALDYAYQDCETAQMELSALNESPDPSTDEIAAAQQKVNAALRTAQEAEQARNAAIAAYNAVEKELQATAASNLAEANILGLDINAKKSILNALTLLQEKDGLLQAPISGTVRGLTLAPGQLSGKLACSLAGGASGYLFTFVLPAEQAERANVGCDVTVMQNGTVEKAALSYVKLLPDNTAQCSVRLKGDKWKEGIAAAKIILSETHHDICIPSTAINQDRQGNFVYIIEEQGTVLGTQTVAVRIAVNVVERGTEQTAVTAALTDKTPVVSTTNRPITGGARVRVNQ